jgi:hypothetical protein
MWRGAVLLPQRNAMSKAGRPASSFREKKMLHFFKPRVSPALVMLLEDVGGGAHKRVDENRELLELLQSRVPHLLDECPWIVGWLQANDEVFVGMAEMAAELRLEPRFGVRTGFPRAWPERCPSEGHGVSVLCTARLCGLRPVPTSPSRPSGSNP